MADVAIAIRTFLLGKSAITDIVSQRIYTDVLPQSATLPAITMRKVSTTHDHQLGDLAGLAHTRLTFDCYASTRKVANQIAEAIRQSGIMTQKGTLTGVDVRGVRIDTGQENFVDFPSDGHDDYRYITSIDFVIDFTET